MVSDDRFFMILLPLHVCNDREENIPYSCVLESQRVQKRNTANFGGAKKHFKDYSSCMNRRVFGFFSWFLIPDLPSGM